MGEKGIPQEVMDVIIENVKNGNSLELHEDNFPTKGAVRAARLLHRFYEENTFHNIDNVQVDG